MSRPSDPLVSVCIANYNGEQLLPDCIDSVLQQSPEVPLEIIVHDDTSCDGSLHLLQARYPDVRVIASTSNAGFCVANNRMAEVARGQYLLLLNNDAALHADALDALLAASHVIAGDAILTLPQFDWDSGALVDRGCLLDPFHVPVPNLDPGREDVAYVVGACLWIPRAAWKRLGGFPDWFGSIAEDMFLCAAARLQAMPVRCLARSGYRHRQGASFGGNRVDAGALRTRYRRRYLSERNRMAVIAICTPTAMAWPWLGLHAIALVAEGGLLALLGRDPRIWREVYAAALRDAWRARAHLRALRVQFQGGRQASLQRMLTPYRWIPWKLLLLWRHGLPTID